jgi:ABC-type Fe2+-enterobactin transport system substrate-binding protein
VPALVPCREIDAHVWQSLPTQIQMINGFAGHAKATIKRTNMRPVQTARFDASLVVGKRADAGFILTGGF